MDIATTGVALYFEMLVNQVHCAKIWMQNCMRLFYTILKRTKNVEDRRVGDEARDESCWGCLSNHELINVEKLLLSRKNFRLSERRCEPSRIWDNTMSFIERD